MRASAAAVLGIAAGVIFARSAVLPLVAGVALTASACAPGTERETASTAALAFYGALDRGDGDAACALLTPETLGKLEQSEGTPCAAAVTSLDVHASGVRSADVYGEQARIVLDGDTAFLAHFRSGWRVSAAGCTERPGQPYDCQLEA